MKLLYVLFVYPRNLLYTIFRIISESKQRLFHFLRGRRKRRIPRFGYSAGSLTAEILRFHIEIILRKGLSLTLIFALSCSSGSFRGQSSALHFPSSGSPEGDDVMSSSTNMSGKENDTDPKLDPLAGAVYLPAPKIGNTGEAAFSYPVEVPSSRAFTPSVMLSYSSGSGDGLCGIGWTLSAGLPSITRTSSNGELFYDSRDTFSFSGRRLVKTKGAASSEDGIYRCEIESDFTRFELRGSGSGGIWFITEKNGRVSVLGESSDSRIYRPENRNRTYCWNFSRSVDLNGNTARAVYDTSSYDEDHVAYLREIRYGGNSRTGFADLQWVKLTYKKRADSYVSKSPGFVMRMNRLIDEIVVGWDDPRSLIFTATDLWKYTLVYEESEESGRPLVRTIESTRNTSSPEFIYSKTDHTLAWNSVSNIWSDDPENDPGKSRYFEGDFNGDGLSDMLFFNPLTGLWRTAERTPNGGYSFKVYAEGFKNYIRDDQIVFFKGNVTGDYNGDGRSDIAFYLPETKEFIVAEGNGRGLSFKSYGKNPYCESDLFACEWFCGDYDGNGLSDVLLFDEKSGRWILMQNLGGRFSFTIVSSHLKNIFREDYSPDSNFDSRSTNDDSPSGKSREKVHFLCGDYNGDGRSDISFYDERTGGWFVGECGRNADGLLSIEWIKYGSFTVPGDVLFGNDRFSGDFNGDGLSDFLWYDRSNGNWMIGETGSRSISFRIFSRMPESIYRFSNITRWLQGDFDGDGRTDVGFYSDSDKNFWIGEAVKSGFRFRIYSNIAYGGSDGDRVLASAPLPKDEVTVKNTGGIVRKNSSSVFADYSYDGNAHEGRGEYAFVGSFSAQNTHELLLFDKKKNEWKLIKSDGSPAVCSNKDIDLGKGTIVILNHERPVRVSGVDMIMYAEQKPGKNADFWLAEYSAGNLVKTKIGTVDRGAFDFDVLKNLYAAETGGKNAVIVNDMPKSGDVSLLRLSGNSAAEYEITSTIGNEQTADNLKSLLKGARSSNTVRIAAINNRVYFCDTLSGKWYRGIFNTGEVKLYVSALSGQSPWNADESQSSLCYDLWNDGVKDILLYGSKKNGMLSFSECQFPLSVNSSAVYTYSAADYSWDGYFDHAHRPFLKYGGIYRTGCFSSGAKSFIDIAAAQISEASFDRSDLYSSIYPFSWIQGDYNGDGKTDLGFFHLKESLWYFALTRGAVPDIISEVKNGIGGKYLFDYAHSSSFDNTGGDGIPDLPVSHIVCSRMSIEDGLGGTISYGFEYKNGCAFSGFVNGRKETDYFGFSEFLIRDSAGGKKISVYNTMPFDDFRKNRALAGAVRVERTIGSDGIEYSRTEYTYALHEIRESAEQSPSYLVEPEQTVTYIKGTAFETRSSAIMLESGKYELTSAKESVTDHYSDPVHGAAETVRSRYFTYDESTNETRLSYAVSFENTDAETRSDYSYDPRGNIASEMTRYTGSGRKKPRDRIVRYEYDEYGNKIKTADESDTPSHIRTAEYDETLHQYLTAETSHGDIDLTGRYGINYAEAFGTTEKKTDPNGNSVYYSYDVFGRLKSQSIDSADGIEKLADYEYPDRGHDTPDGFVRDKISAKVIQYSGDGGKKELRIFADGLGRTIHSVWSAESFSGRRYAKSGKITYDSLGRIVRKGLTSWARDEEIDEYLEAAEVNPTITEYDPSGRISQVILPKAYDGEPQVYTKYSYNDPWEKTVTHSIGRSKKTVTNARGLVVYVEDSGRGDDGSPAEARMGFMYDIAGLRIKKTDLNNTVMNGSVDTSLFAPGKKDTSGNAVCFWRYDGFGKLTDSSDPDTGYSGAEYDGFGNMTKRIDARGRTTLCEYDSFGRITRKVLPGSEGGVRYCYDEGENGKGKLTFVDDPAQVKKLVYDKIGRVRHEERIVKGNDQVFETDFAYDLMNRTTSITYPEDPSAKLRITARYSYCAYGITSIEFERLLYNSFIVQNIRYNEFGQMEHLERGNGINSDYIYDVRGRLNNLVTKKGTETLQDVKYNFRTDNSISSKEDSFGADDSARKVRYEYSYDGLNRLADAQGLYLQGTDGTKAKRFHSGYSYSSNGNISGKKEYSMTGSAEELMSYSYERSGHALSKITSAVNGVICDMRYDDCGNMVYQNAYSGDRSDRAKEIEYNSSGRMTRIRNPETGAVRGEYQYDDQGFRVKKISAEIVEGAESRVEVTYPSMYFAVEKQLDSGGNEIAGTSYACNNIYLNGVRIAASLPDGTCQYYLTDQVDSVTVVADNQGSVVTRTEYLPFGETWMQEGDSKSRPKYNNQELDAESGLYYYNARYYDSAISRFVTADTLVDGEYDTQGWNRYSYCHNNPILYKDPSGHDDRSGISWGKDGKVDVEATRANYLQKAGANIGSKINSIQAKKMERAKDSVENRLSSKMDNITIIDNIEIPIPLKYQPAITSKFGYRQRNGTFENHSGIDVVPQKKEDGSWVDKEKKEDRRESIISALGEGRVIHSGDNQDGYGNSVIIDHGNGITSLYGHQSSLTVKKNDIVKKGDQIGKVGNTGISDAYHVHWEIRKNGKAIDPQGTTVEKEVDK